MILLTLPRAPRFTNRCAAALCIQSGRLPVSPVPESPRVAARTRLPPWTVDDITVDDSACGSTAAHHRHHRAHVRRAHLTRTHGVFAPSFKHRHRIIPNPVHQAAREPPASRPRARPLDAAAERVFPIDIEHCGVCGGTLRVIACIETTELIRAQR